MYGIIVSSIKDITVRVISFMYLYLQKMIFFAILVANIPPSVGIFCLFIIIDFVYFLYNLFTIIPACMGFAYIII